MSQPSDDAFAYRYIPETDDWVPKQPARADGGFNE